MFYKIQLAALAIVVCAAGYATYAVVDAFSGDEPTPPVPSAANTKSNTTTKHVTTKAETTVKADGTKVISQTKEEVGTTDSVTAVVKAPNNWSLGAEWRPKLDTESFKPSALEVGRRVFGDVWIDGSYDFDQKSFGVGVKVEF